MNKIISTTAGVFILVTLGLLAGSLIWWQGELTKLAEARISLSETEFVD